MFRSIAVAAHRLFVIYQLVLGTELFAQQIAGRQPQVAPGTEDGIKIPPEIQQMLKDGDQLRIDGKPLEAAKKFREAQDVTTNVRYPEFEVPQVQSVALLREAGIHYSEAIKSNDRQKLTDVLRLYDKLHSDAAPMQKTQAAMNRAALHMRLGNPKKAAELLLNPEECDWSTVDQSQQFLLNYNVGRALDQDKTDSERALKFYGKALSQKPQFSLAASKICDLVISDNTLSSESLDEQVNLLVSTKQSEEVSRLGWHLFERGGEANQTGAMNGLSILLTGWSMTIESGESFLKAESERLVQLKESFIGPEFERDIMRLVQGELAVEVATLENGRHSQLSGINEVIAGADTEQVRLKVALSALTFAIADGFATQSAMTTDPTAARANVQAALTRNIVAFGLDPQNTDAARSLVWCLSRVEEMNPTEINEDLRNQVIYSLLKEKEGILDKKNMEISDWQNLLKIHMLLGHLFQSQGIWVAADSRLSATFHWEEARQNEIELNRRLTDNLQQWTPALHENLGTCYFMSDRIAEAVASFLNACDFFLRNDDLPGATRCLQRVQSIGVDLTAGQQELVAELDRRIQDLDQRIKSPPQSFP